MNDPITSIAGLFGYEMDVSTLRDGDLSPKETHNRLMDSHLDAKKDTRKLIEWLDRSWNNL